ncbi:hypothetical protein QTP88_018960 [Uroleucon formosanum]
MFIVLILPKYLKLNITYLNPILLRASIYCEAINYLSILFQPTVVHIHNIRDNSSSIIWSLNMYNNADGCITLGVRHVYECFTDDQSPNT